MTYQHLDKPSYFFALCFKLHKVCLSAFVLLCFQVTANADTFALSNQPLRFADFFQLPIGSHGLQLTPKLLQAQGTRVELTGYMVLQENGSKPGQFFFTPRPVRMSEHADGDADDLPPSTVLVKLAPAQSSWIVPHTQGMIRLHGILSVGRQETEDGRVHWVQLQLDPEAIKNLNALEYATYLHSLQHRHR